MLLLVPVFGIVGLIYMFVLRSWVVKQDSGSEKMTKLAAYIKEGALAFLNAEYRILAIFVVVAGALLGIVSSIVETTHWFIVVAFIIGAVFSAVAGNIGSGKTTLTKLLSKHYGWEPNFEDVDENPYLNDFAAQKTSRLGKLALLPCLRRHQQSRTPSKST